MLHQTQEKRSDSRHIVISGGSKGLGLYISQQLLLNGYKVSTFSRHKTNDVESLQASHSGEYYFSEVDSASSEGLAMFCKQAAENLGAFYGVINNSAIAIDGIFATLPEIEMENMLAVNLMGSFCLTRHCVRKMLLSKSGGRIISISSIAANRGYKGLTVYAATKSALEGMTRSLARELGECQITVNAIAPGYMLTDISKSLSEKQKEQIIRRTPLGRLTEFEDVFPLIELLLSKKGGFITGQTITVDGGLSI